MDKVSVTRYAVLIVAVINAVLNLVGFQTIPDELVNDVVAVITGAYALWVAWKNNYISRKGLRQKEVLEKNGLK